MCVAIRFNRALILHMRAVARAELAAMAAAEQWQRQYLVRLRQFERAREARELASMQRYEKQQRLLDAAIARAEAAREEMARTTMGEEETRQRYVMRRECGGLLDAFLPRCICAGEFECISFLSVWQVESLCVVVRCGSGDCIV